MSRPTGWDLMPFLVTYTSDGVGRVALRSSICLRNDGEWLLRFHQGTVLAQV